MDIDSVHGGVSGGEHRIHNDAATVLQFRRHTDQVLDRLLVFVAVETDMADTGGRHQSEETVRHAEAGAEHGNNHILLAGDHGTGVSIRRVVRGVSRVSS